MYLSAFYFPDAEMEASFMFDLKTTYDQSVYPYGVLPKTGLTEIIFRPITILYGGNGCGKSTALNVIAEKLGLIRATDFNRTRFFLGGKFFVVFLFFFFQLFIAFPLNICVT